jgi:hypothetical protein
MLLVCLAASWVHWFTINVAKVGGVMYFSYAAGGLHSWYVKRVPAQCYAYVFGLSAFMPCHTSSPVTNEHVAAAPAVLIAGFQAVWCMKVTQIHPTQPAAAAAVGLLPSIPAAAAAAAATATQEVLGRLQQQQQPSSAVQDQLLHIDQQSSIPWV